MRIGRLAVDRGHCGGGLGAALIVNAGGQVRRAGIGAFMLVVDAKDNGAAAFYRHIGFVEIGSDRVFGLPLSTAAKALNS